jgi:serine protease AprX
MKHSRIFLNYLILMTAVILFYSFDNYGSKMSDELSRKISYQNAEDKDLVWIYFTDKGENIDSRLSSPELFLTAKSIERRMKRVKSENIFDERDIPVNSNYINELTSSGLIIKNKSKWFNAVSCYANKIQLENIISKSFIKKIELVGRYKKSSAEESDNQDNGISFQNENTSLINYGPSLSQSNIIDVPPVHDRGFTGDGVLIASFDAGFDNLQHDCFNRMRSKGLRTYDFVNGDTIVADGEGRMGSGAHGTLTLSLVCGYDEGHLVSPAFNSTFILAKTENTNSETPLEEDNWVAAAEWADSLGADIITSSLGYLEFQSPYPSYTWQSMDGNTATITIAADIAVSKGIVVVTSAGNRGYNISHNTLEAPADGDNVITVGAVTSISQRASYSSVGPTYDGRIKPDVMAMGSFNYCATPFIGGQHNYVSGATGTSLSCPMVAAVCALVLCANPNLTPIQVRNIIRETAYNNSLPPNNLTGWGIVDALAAVQKAQNTATRIPSDYVLQQNYPNPFNPSTTFRFTLSQNANVSIIIYDASGRMMDKIIDNKFYAKGYQELNYTNGNLSSGVYFYSMFANGALVDSKKMVLIY